MPDVTSSINSYRLSRFNLKFNRVYISVLSTKISPTLNVLSGMLSVTEMYFSVELKI